MHDSQLDLASLLKQSAACMPERVRMLATPHVGYNNDASMLEQFKVSQVSCLSVVALAKVTYAMQ